jgi:hypothetical protein
MWKIIALTFALLSTLRADVLLTDSFDGSSIDSSKWNINLPFATSQAYVSNGKFVSYDRGIITTKAAFNPYLQPYMVEGVFTPENWQTVFCVTLRGNGNLDIPSSESLGIRVGFWSSAFDPGLSINPIFLNATGTGVSALPAFAIGSPYTFAITDFGDTITVAINGTEVAVANVNDYKSGGSISLFSSYQNGLNQVDNFKVSSVPEPSALSLLTVGFGALAVIRRRRS